MASTKALYLDSVKDRATIHCFLNIQDIKLEPKNIATSGLIIIKVTYPIRICKDLKYERWGEFANIENKFQIAFKIS